MTAKGSTRVWGKMGRMKTEILFVWLGETWVKLHYILRMEPIHKK